MTSLTSELRRGYLIPLIWLLLRRELPLNVVSLREHAFWQEDKLVELAVARLPSLRNQQRQRPLLPCQPQRRGYDHHVMGRMHAWYRPRARHLPHCMQTRQIQISYHATRLTWRMEAPLSAHCPPKLAEDASRVLPMQDVATRYESLNRQGGNIHTVNGIKYMIKPQTSASAHQGSSMCP